MCSPMKSNFFFLALIASSTHFTWTDTTESTSTEIRLNSSKHPHAPVWHKPLVGKNINKSTDLLQKKKFFHTNKNYNKKLGKNLYKYCRKICNPFVRSSWTHRPWCRVLCPNLSWFPSSQYQPDQLGRCPLPDANSMRINRNKLKIILNHIRWQKPLLKLIYESKKIVRKLRCFIVIYESHS